MPNSDTAIVIPVFNEATVVGSVIERATEHFDLIICVDDGSADNSAGVIDASGAVLVRHPINLGQGAALQTGIEYALLHPRIRYIVTYDADGQHRIEDAVAMVDLIRGGEVDIVFGSRFMDSRTRMNVLKRVVLKLAVAYTTLTTGVRLTDAHNGLRVLTREAARSLQLRHNGMAHASEIIEAVKRERYRYTEVPVQILYTDYSKSKGQSVLNSVNILFDLLLR